MHDWDSLKNLKCVLFEKKLANSMAHSGANITETQQNEQHGIYWIKYMITGKINADHTTQ